MSDFNLLIKARSGRLIRAMRAKGIRTGAELARRAGISIGSACRTINMEDSPFSRRFGELYTERALKIAAALDVMPSDIWPEHLRGVKPKRGGVELDVSADEVARYLAPDDQEKSLIQRELTTKLLASLPARYERVVRLHMDGATFDEIGEEMDVHKARAAQMFQKAIRDARRKAERMGIRNSEGAL